MYNVFTCFFPLLAMMPGWCAAHRAPEEIVHLGYVGKGSSVWSGKKGSHSQVTQVKAIGDETSSMPFPPWLWRDGPWLGNHRWRWRRRRVRTRFSQPLASLFSDAAEGRTDRFSVRLSTALHVQKERNSSFGRHTCPQEQMQQCLFRFLYSQHG